MFHIFLATCGESSAPESMEIEFICDITEQPSLFAGESALKHRMFSFVFPIAGGWAHVLR